MIQQYWHPADIIAALKKRGMTLDMALAVALAAGL